MVFLEQILAIRVCIGPLKLRSRLQCSSCLTKTNLHFWYTHLGHHFRYCRHWFWYTQFLSWNILFIKAFRFNTLLQSANSFFYLFHEMAHITHNALHEASKYECVVVGSNLPEIAMKKWCYNVTGLSHRCQIGLLRNSLRPSLSGIVHIDFWYAQFPS